MEHLQIVTLPIKALKPYKNNAKIHSDYDVDAIKQSIQEFGFNDPIAVWGEENLIIEGHGRLLAAQKLRMTEIPCIRLDSLTDEQRRAYALVHNKLVTNTGFDISKLLEELDKIEEVDMEKYGFAEFQAIEQDLDEFFDGPDERPEETPKTNIQFTITPKDKLQDLIDFLMENEIDYDEQ